MTEDFSPLSFSERILFMIEFRIYTDYSSSVSPASASKSSSLINSAEID